MHFHWALKLGRLQCWVVVPRPRGRGTLHVQAQQVGWECGSTIQRSQRPQSPLTRRGGLHDLHTVCIHLQPTSQPLFPEISAFQGPCSSFTPPQMLPTHALPTQSQPGGAKAVSAGLGHLGHFSEGAGQAWDPGWTSTSRGTWEKHPLLPPCRVATAQTGVRVCGPGWSVSESSPPRHSHHFKH